MRTLYLVQPADPYGPNKFLPLAISYQWLFAKNPRWDLADVVIEKLPIGPYVAKMVKPDLVAMSCYIWNWEYNKELARQIKARFPNVTIVVGGPQVPKDDPHLFLSHPYFDIAVHGEGEAAFKEILHRFPGRKFDDLSNVQSASQMAKSVQRVTHLEEIPSPILTGFYEQIIAKYPADTLWQVTIETMRGCPYHCGFCDMGDSSWDRLQKFDLGRILSEIDWIGKNKIEYVSVCDSNWGLLERDKEITEYVIKTKLKYGYPKVWDVTMAKHSNQKTLEMALLDKVSKTRLFKGVTLALQSLNEKSLSATRRYNLSDSKLKGYLDVYRQENIPTYSELIWPLPGETLESFKSGIQKLIDFGQEDFLMVHPLVLTPNSPLSNNSTIHEYGIKTKTVPLDTYYLNISAIKDAVLEKTEAVYETKTASYEDVMSGFMFSYVFITFYYYGWAHYLAKHICRKLGITEVRFFEDLQVWMVENPDSMIGAEYAKTLRAIRGVFDNQELWGRQVRGQQDILWEYKGASSVVFQMDRGRLQGDLKSFVSQRFGDSFLDAVDLGLLMCCDFRQKYPKRVKVNRLLAAEMFGYDSEELVIDRDDGQPPKDEDEFFAVAYHYQRKNRYWRNSVKGLTRG